MERMFLVLLTLWLMIQIRHSLVLGTKESHDRTLQSANHTLNKPEIINWEINGHHIVVNWKHSSPNQQLLGYYVSLCKLVNSECDGPDFVNFGKTFRSGRIVGLAPEATYKVEVIAYSAEEHRSSDAVLIDTNNLQFLLAKNLTVSLVTCCHAVFQFQHEPQNNIHDVDFVLQCAGQRQYIDAHKKIVEEESTFDHTTPSTSQNREIFFANNLDPNTKYLCTMSSMSGTITSPPSQHLSFTTQSGKPSTPPTPVLSLEKDNVFTASLYPTDERFGPISHYMLIAVPVSKSMKDPLTAPYDPIVPLKHLLQKALTSATVADVSQPLPFIVSKFKPEDLPINFNFGYEWTSIFKKNTYYSVVLVAFTKNSNLFHSISMPSNPVYITEDLAEAWVKKQRPVAKRFTVIIVGSIFSLVILFTIAFLIVFISNYCYAKRREAKQYKFVVSETDSSEEEIFTKLGYHEKLLKDDDRPRTISSKGSEIFQGRPQRHEAPVTLTQRSPVTLTQRPHEAPVTLTQRPHEAPVTLTQRSPNKTYAEWAMENMSHRSPAFRDMIKRHPETLDEMNEVMTKVGQKWEHQARTAEPPAKLRTHDPRPIHRTRGSHICLSSESSEPIYSAGTYSGDTQLPPPVPPRFHSHQFSGQQQHRHHRHYHESPDYYYEDSDSMSEVDLT